MRGPWSPLASSILWSRGKLALRDDAWRLPDGTERAYPAWELPGGGARAGEAPEAAAQRELREEGGYRAAQLVLLTRFWPSAAYLDEVAWCYVAHGLTPDPLPADDDEFLERSVVPAAEAIRMALDGEITESVSKVTLLQYALQGWRPV